MPYQEIRGHQVYVPDHLEEIVNNVEFFPKWRAWLDVSWEADGAGGLHLWILSDTVNSLNFDERIGVRHPFLVPPASWNHDNWLAWVFERHLDVLRHEGGEFFRYKGERVFAPHHADGEDPYRTWFVSDYATAVKKQGDK